MDQNQTLDNNTALEKAIEDIAGATNNDSAFTATPTPPSPLNLPTLDPPLTPEVPETPSIPETPTISEAPEPTSVIEKPEIEPIPNAADTDQIKKAALRDLGPLLGHLTSISPTQKFNIYRNIFQELRDYTILEPAYNAAREIPDETERAEALLYLVESIDKM